MSKMKPIIVFILQNKV